MRSQSFAASVSALALALGLAAPACAQDKPLAFSGYLNVDLLAPLAGEGGRRISELDKLHVNADADLAALIGAPGLTAHASLLNTSGAAPNERIGVLQGVDNIESLRARLRLYEAWLDQRMGDVSLRAGLYDLNTEFYATAPAALLIGPSFGIGPELSATGVNGPSIFPSTALTVRVSLDKPGGYVRAAALNADARTLGDPGGLRFNLSGGALLVGEAGLTKGQARVSLGGWSYTRHPAVLDPEAPAGLGQAAGAYVMAEGPLHGRPDEAGYTVGFVRAGLANRAAQAFSHAVQAGVLIGPVWDGRPASALSLGYAGARPRLPGVARTGWEHQFELTFADEVFPHLTIQPDLQYVISPGGLRDAPDAVVAAVRFTLAFGD